MPSGSCSTLADLPPRPRALLEGARRGVLSTAGADGWPHSVPVVFVVSHDVIVSPVDDKPKSGGELVRLRNIASNPVATLLVDHWDEDWTRLAWVMVRARAQVEKSDASLDELRKRYPQYTDEITPGERTIVLTPKRISWWSWVE